MRLSTLEGPINNLSYALRQKGISKGTKVAFVATNEWPIVMLFVALLRLQAIACPLSPRLPNLSPFLSALQPDFFLKPEDLSFEKAPLISYSLDENQIATYLFTSGSGGTPKIAAHSYGNHFFSALGMVETLPFNHDHSWFLSVPLHHVSGISILFRCLITDASLLLPPALWEEASHLSLVPTQVLRLEKALDATILVGGGPIPQALYSRGLRLKTSYGLTEMSSTVTLDGQILPFREMMLAEDKEIFVRGKTLFQGYYPHLNQSPEQWFPTGDLGTLIDGKLQIIGRKDNLFISGGENIQPEEVEAALQQLPHMIQAVVVPIDDPLFGQRPVVFIDSLQDYSLQEVHHFLSDKLPRFKWPVQILPFPAQTTFKPSRSYLRQLVQSSHSELSTHVSGSVVSILVQGTPNSAHIGPIS